MKPVHHTTEMSDKCTGCGRPFLMRWFDADENNGQSETMWRDMRCTACATRVNSGRPPLSMRDINEIRRRGITNDQYYHEKGYE